MKTRKITTAFATSVAALLLGTFAAFAAEPRVWTNSRGEIALRGTLDVERTLDATPGVEAPNRVYFVDATGGLYSFRYRHLSEADRALVDEALDEPAPPKKVGTRRDVATPLGTSVPTPPGVPPRRPRAEANLALSPPTEIVAPKSDASVSSKRPATVRVKIKLVDATGAPIPRAWFQGKILGGAATTSLRAHSDEDGGFTIALTPGVEYEALVTAPRGGSAVFYERAKFRAPEANFDSASLTLNVGEGKEMKLTDRAAQEISNEFRPEDEALETLAIEAKPTEPASSDDKAESTAPLGSAARRSNAVESREKTTLKVVDSAGKPVPFAVVKTSQVVQGDGLKVFFDLRADGAGVVSAEFPRGVEYEATVRADVPERVLEEGETGLVGLVAKKYEGLRFYVPEGTGERVVVLTLSDDAEVADKPKTTESEENALNDGDSETADAE